MRNVSKLMKSLKVMKAPDKIYVHEASAPELTEKLPYHIEYTRTDAFIEKATAWLDNSLDGVFEVQKSDMSIPLPPATLRRIF